MTYFGTTQGTASWLLGKTQIIEGLNELLLSSQETLDLVAESDFVEGPIRISGLTEPSLICAWNVDYTSGLGDDPWGFINLGSSLGLAGRPEISKEVLERCVYVISQRLQGLLIDGAFIHRAWPNGSHTCLAGRGTEARHFSVAYFERDVPDGAVVLHSVLCIGPEYNLDRLQSESERRADVLPQLLPAARRLYNPTRKRSILDSGALSQLRAVVSPYVQPLLPAGEFGEVSVTTDKRQIPERDTYRTANWTYRDWLAETSTLTQVQRRILTSTALENHPIRILGPGGSGKTLLMELLALRRLESAAQKGDSARVLYLVHNSKMAETVDYRFSILRQGLALPESCMLTVSTLTQYGIDELSLTEHQVVDPDAYQAREFQLETMLAALADTFKIHSKEVGVSKLLREVSRDPGLMAVFTRLVMEEVSGAIKGHGLVGDERRYVESQRPLSRLHALLNPGERRLVFAAFRNYHKVIFEGYRVLDGDDVAISLFGKLKTPAWELHRRDLGFDHVFVDEAQLYNENERRVLPLLSKSTTPYVPLVLALDEAQQLYGHTAAGLATLGIENIANESLPSIHRSSRDIARLAFFVIQRSTDLFGPDFPDFTGLAASLPADGDPLPCVEGASGSVQDYPRFILRRVRALRKAGLRRLTVICLAEAYWTPVLSGLKGQDLPLHVLENRGEKLHPTEHTVVLSRPAHIGGQEFDGAIIVGAEQGLTPPRVLHNDALAGAVEQQSLREIYLAITRAKHRVMITLAPGATLTAVLADARSAGLLGLATGND